MLGDLVPTCRWVWYVKGTSPHSCFSSLLRLYLELRGGTEARAVLGLQRACVFSLAPVTLTSPRKTCVYDATPISELPQFGGTCGTTLQVLLSTTHPTRPVAAGNSERKTSSYFENTRNPESSFLRHLNEKRKNQDDPNPIIWKQGLAPSPTNRGLAVIPGSTQRKPSGAHSSRVPGFTPAAGGSWSS